MIVICTKCKVKFRMADERVGPRGVKVRCSRCGAVFSVKRDGAAHPAQAAAPPAHHSGADGSAGVRVPAGATGPSGSSSRSAGPRKTPGDHARSVVPELAEAATAADAGVRPLAREGLPADVHGPGGEADPSPSRGPLGHGSDADPFESQWTVDPFASSGAADPFAVAAPGLALAGTAGADPFVDPFAGEGRALAPSSPARGGGRSEWSAAPVSDAFATVPDDPFGPDRFGGLGTREDVLDRSDRGSATHLPLTDLSDLLGPPAPAASSTAAAEVAAPSPAVTPTDELDLVSAELDLGADRPELSSGGLTLEDRTTPPPAQLSRGEGGPGSADLDVFGARSAAFGAAFELARPSEEPLALAEPDDRWASPPAGGHAGRSPAEAPAAPPRPRPAREGAPDTRSRVDGAPPAGDAPGRPPFGAPGRTARVAPGSRLRAAVVNVVALAALLLLALALLVAWRSEGPLEARAFRPAAILQALRIGPSPGAFSTQGITSGLYEREKGPPFLFVRGDVVSRASSVVPAVRVSVEVVRDGQVIARGEARAGAVPTPEELHGARDAPALAAAAGAAARRAPSEVRPGDVLPFLVAISDHPADLSGASLRVAVAGVERAGRP